LYTEYARFLILGHDKLEALHLLRADVKDYLLERATIPADELHRYHKILLHAVGIYAISPLEELSREEVNSSGYVVSTLEASLWSLLKTDSFADAVLTAINLGEDTDTTGAVTGGLAGLLYGRNSIPGEWLAALARLADIEDLAVRLQQRILSSRELLDK